MNSNTPPYCIVRKCCLVCEHASIGDIDHRDESIPCHHRDNMVDGGTPRVAPTHVCECFELTTLLSRCPKMDMRGWKWPCKYLKIGPGRHAECCSPTEKDCPKRQLRNTVSKSCWDYK